MKYEPPVFGVSFLAISVGVLFVRGLDLLMPTRSEWDAFVSSAAVFVVVLITVVAATVVRCLRSQRKSLVASGAALDVLARNLGIVRQVEDDESLRRRTVEAFKGVR